MPTGNDLVDEWAQRVYTATVDFGSQIPEGWTEDDIRTHVGEIAGPEAAEDVVESFRKPLLSWEELTGQEKMGWLMAVVMRLLPFSIQVAETIRDARPVREAAQAAAQN